MLGLILLLALLPAPSNLRKGEPAGVCDGNLAHIYPDGKMDIGACGTVDAVTVPLTWDSPLPSPDIPAPVLIGIWVYRGLKADCSDCVRVLAPFTFPVVQSTVTDPTTGAVTTTYWPHPQMIFGYDREFQDASAEHQDYFYAVTAEYDQGESPKSNIFEINLAHPPLNFRLESAP